MLPGGKAPTGSPPCGIEPGAMPAWAIEPGCQAHSGALSADPGSAQPGAPASGAEPGGCAAAGMPPGGWAIDVPGDAGTAHGAVVTPSPGALVLTAGAAPSRPAASPRVAELAGLVAWAGPIRPPGPMAGAAPAALAHWQDRAIRHSASTPMPPPFLIDAF
eukprot:scaffold13737_cov95-Isochrysis_galbana.AAC.4